jgi:uncharacterized membrane protein
VGIVTAFGLPAIVGVTFVVLVNAIRSSFWFVPAVMTASAALLSLGAIALDRTLVDGTSALPGHWIYTGGPEGARQLLSTVAGSMVTVLGVVFSVTIVALQLASSQFGPRLLRQFLRDTGNQVALGSFAAIFTYCLLVLRSVRGDDSDSGAFVPHFATTGGIALAVFGVGVLIYFIHHVAMSIQADVVVAMVSEDLRQAIDGVFPEPRERDDAERSDESGTSHHDGPESMAEITSTSEGYIQAIAVDTLVRRAEQHAVVVHIRRNAGDFVMRGSTLAHVSPSDAAERLPGRIRQAFLIGRQRTPSQDVGFGVRQLVEVAVRALSPSINDPATALAVVDRLGAALVQLGERRLPSRDHRGADGIVRVVMEPVRIRDVIDAPLDNLRQHAVREPAVALRVLEMIALVAARTDRRDLRAVLLQQARMLEAAARKTIGVPGDARDLAVRFERARQALAQR